VTGKKRIFFNFCDQLFQSIINELQAGFIVAVGKTFKSGRLNIPVNMYVVPSKDGIRMGASFGFNAKRY
jgi:hypothetical protein